MPLRKHQSGVGLIEILIAFLLLSIGGVGLASMQLKAKRLSYDAVQRTIATSLTRDIIERMRNNPNFLATYVVDDLGGGSIANEPTPDCTTASCTPAELAAHDLWEWERALDGATESVSQDGTVTFTGGLDSPRACITHLNGVVTVAIAWKGFMQGQNATTTQCGEGLGLYGPDEEERQVIMMTSFIESLTYL